jgi:NTP pyrophosphatase (non-canonical NTP hydrolase)
MAQRKHVQRVNKQGRDGPSLEQLRDRLRDFAAARDWNQFHSPKNLAIALSVEAGELLEHFQWISDRESMTLPDDKLGKIKDEIADVLLYLIRLADLLNVDLIKTADTKIEVNAQKYPVDKSRGSAKKYTEL